MSVKTAVLRGILFIILAILIASVILMITISRGIKPFIENRLSIIFQRPVSIESISVKDGSAVWVRGLTVHDIDSPEKKPALRIERIIFTAQLASLMDKKALPLDIDIENLVIWKSDFLKSISRSAPKKQWIPFVVGTININNCRIKIPILEQIVTEIDGTLTFEKNSIAVKLISPELLVDSVITTTQAISVAIAKCELRYGSSSFSLRGTIQDLRQYRFLDLRVSSLLETEDIAALSPVMGVIFGIFKIHGQAGITGARIQGRADTPEGISAAAHLTLKNLQIYDQKFERLKTTLELERGTLVIPRLTAWAYGGEITGAMRFDISAPEKSFHVKASFDNLDFSEIIQNTGLRDKGIFGIFEGKLSLEGILGDQKTYTGKMFLRVKDGNLGPLPIFNPVISSLTLIIQRLLPGYERVMLTESSGDFLIRNRHVTTKNLAAWGETASVWGQGYVDFDGNLDLNIENNFAEGLSTGKWAQGIQNIISSMGNSISQGRLTGTLKKPQYKSTSTADFTNFFKDAMDVFKDIF